MHLIPKSRQEWGQLIYFPFRAYVLLAFIATHIVFNSWPRHGGIPDFMPLFTLNYAGCFLIFLLGGIVQLATNRHAEAAVNLAFAVVTFLIGYDSLLYLSSV